MKKGYGIAAMLAALGLLVFGVVSATAGSSQSMPTATPHNHAAHTQGLTQSDLRALLGRQLGEHAALAMNATNLGVTGSKAFPAAAKALDRNSVAISKAIGSVYGAGAEQAFLPLWRKHIGFFVDYTQGAAAKDRAKQDRAVADLVAYTQDFGAFLQSANPKLPKATVAELVKTHALTLKAVVDAQASMDAGAAYWALEEAAAHMQMIADPVAAALAAQFPERFGR